MLYIYVCVYIRTCCKTGAAKKRDQIKSGLNRELSSFPLCLTPNTNKAKQFLKRVWYSQIKS